MGQANNFHIQKFNCAAFYSHPLVIVCFFVFFAACMHTQKKDNVLK